MGGIFGIVSNEDCVMDIFFGTDYHSHLGTKKVGCAYLGIVVSTELYTISKTLLSGANSKMI